MRISVSGHPIHGRVLELALRAGAAGRLDAAGELVDVRKRGFVPVAGQLQPSGVVHHMHVEARIEPEAGLVETIASRMPRVAFEPSELTAGETCRDVEHRLAALSGRPLSALASGLSAEIGGPRGCSHVLALARALCAAAEWLLACERSLAPRAGGELVFHRALALDGHDAGGGRIVLALQQTDLHCRPAPPLAAPMARFGTQVELRATLEIDLASAAIARAQGAVRRRDAATLESASFESLDARLSELAGKSFFGGFAGECLARFGSAPEDRPLLDALLQVAPGFLQCMAGMSEAWPAASLRSGSFIGTGGHPDACYIWRRDGALGRQLLDEQAAGKEFLRARRRR
jgi:hypothetical protein